ncbi:MAG TPA: restriction endonuclease, SacI family [Bryobacteraceae bacterium]|jgi:hypothetical protein|nr:restriction endonuclease, SacI family [Bryobacteraceae bacterium]
MKKINLDHDAALTVLRSATKRARLKDYTPQSKYSKEVQAIITGSHLTYKYILITALLAKATDDRIHPLALQAGADLDGAYDARSLCHSVIVPNEAGLLDNALGGSNEPYLNKPARFTQVDLKNPVRQGNDKRTLQTLHSTLSAIKNSKDALLALHDAIFFATQRIARDTAALETAIEKLDGGRQQIAAYFEKLISKSEHGETCVLAVGGLFWLMAITRAEKWKIAVHPVNESGTSSNEVSDIDVRIGSKLIITAEVKDKTFIAKDVAHAVSRVQREGFHTLHFIQGPRAELVEASDDYVRSQAAKAGVELHLIVLENLADGIIPFAPKDVTLKDFAEAIAAFAKEARVKDETLQHLRSITEELEE